MSRPNPVGASLAQVLRLRNLVPPALVRLEVDARSSLRGLLSGVLRLADGSELHFREFVDVGLDEPRLMYAYQTQDNTQALVFRYDNAAHRPALPAAEH